MQTIIASKDEQKIQTITDNLTREDKAHCDHVFSIYHNHVTHVSELLQAIETKNVDYESRNINDDQNFSCFSKIDKATEALNDTLECLTQSLVEKLEYFFTKKYCLVFSSLIPDRGSINLNPVCSYDFIIENIIGQVGNNFLQAGKEQIKHRFLKSFYRSSLPTLKGNKISMPSFISIDEHWGERISLSYSHNKRLENLINALNLFLNDSTELPQTITNKLQEWKREIDLSQHYSVFSGVSFKFFKNHRIDVLFSDAITARKFWNYYALEIIEKFIQEND